MVLYLNGVAVGMATDVSIRMGTSEIDVSSKDSARWKEILPGQRDWGVDHSAIVAFDSTLGMKEIYALEGTKVKIKVKVKTTPTTTDYWHGEAYLTSVEMTAPLEDKVTFTCALTGTGVLTCSTAT
jgi:TP901-1 family phage major tail protein